MIKKMMSLKYQDGTLMTDHLNTFQGIINQLAGINIKFEEEVQGLWLLGTLPNLWETFRISLSNSVPNGTMNMDLIKSCVLNEEMRRKSQGSYSQSDVLVTKKRGKSKSRGPNNRDKSKSKTNKFANVECHYFHLKGHIRKYCRQLKRDMKQGKVEDKKNDNDAVSSIYATPQKDFFTSYTSGDFGSVRMGNDGSTKAISMGDVRLETSNGTMLILKNVKHILDIRMNLISTGKLDDEGFCNTFRDSQWKLTRVDDDSTVELWHNKLDHMSEKGLMILAKKNLFSDMKKGSLKRCAHCLAGKQTRVAFKTHRHTRKSGMLDLVYSDVCGPMKTKTLGGSLYFVTFIDDHSRKIWVYTLKTKYQVLEVFKQFHAFVERQFGEKLKCIWTDNGGEYSGPFDEYCRQHGIRNQKTPLKTPYLNGLAKRMNRTLVERVRCLLLQSQLPRSFWGEALNTVVHVLNLTPCVPLEFDVPDRIWSNNER
ncbi:Retrovirus-related Pol polyprotein from transposon TNT 1-94 [Vitis vinifera]|uniref:Retrovirus-related Pol polyprotein from transposon TNT 1-94 n=1 Tax=Vitis vinifera TaxID=29760 RepID=A0A438JB85_VITVI|nr:Retrovirus-related Pol polyprotein from transposon TNT 1-94 [Vitis vinifera]